MLPWTGLSSLRLNFVKLELDAISWRGGSCGNLLKGERRNLENEQSQKDWAEKRQHAKQREPKTYYHTLESF